MFCLLVSILLTLAAAPDAAAPKPLYRDPVHDGAADPGLVRNRRTGEWFMFYTSRRADADCADGVSWAHGTAIGVARSKDMAVWKYAGQAEIRYAPDPRPSYWAPCVIDDGRLYHMFLTYVPGTFCDWDHPRNIIHLTSRNLKRWKFHSRLQLMSDRVIDADVQALPEGGYRMWYNQEPGGKLIACADSPDLNIWYDCGPVPGIGSCEAPKVFRWRGWWWMICDEWRGLAVFRSSDAVGWTRQEGVILGEPGAGADDGAVGHHCDVVVAGPRAFIFYFTHPDTDASSGGNPRRSVIQVAELRCDDGATLSCDRNSPVKF